MAHSAAPLVRTGSAPSTSADRSRFRSRRVRGLGLVVAGAIALASLAGCAKMDAALSKQWIVVNFKPGTSAATALQVRLACSHVANTPPLPMPAKHSVINVMYGVRYDTTNSSPAEEAQLQTCLNKFSSVAGVNPMDTGSEGS